MSKEKKYIPKYKIDSKKWFLAWNNPKNPFGNYHEPMPYPLINEQRAPKNEFMAFLWWQFYRNPFHNYTHFNIGIIPIGERYEWITPDEDGWVREHITPDHACWVKGNKRKCRKYFKFLGLTGYIGWAARGSWGMALRRSKD